MKTRLRALALLLLLASGTTGGVAAVHAVPGLLAPDATADVGELLSALLAWVVLGCAAWLVLITAVATLEILARGAATVSWRWTPGAVRLVLIMACGAGIVAAAATGAGAEARPTPLDERLPDRAAGAIAAPAAVEPVTVLAVGPVDSTGPTTRATVVVAHGDTLWAIARAYGLEWPELYDANQVVIGGDPDLILPGQELVLPPPTTKAAS